MSDLDTYALDTYPHTHCNNNSCSMQRYWLALFGRNILGTWVKDGLFPRRNL